MEYTCALVKSDSLSDFSCSTVSFSNSNEDDAFPTDKHESKPTKDEEPKQPPKVDRVRRLPVRSISMPRGLRWNRDEHEAENGSLDQPPIQPVKEEKIRRPPPRTNSMPKRTIWKDKGGPRYVANEAPPAPELKPVGLATVAKEALTDAVITGGAAGLAVFDAVTATKRRFDRQLSQKRLSVEESSTIDEADEEPGLGGRFVQGRRGLLRRAKSLGTIRGSGAPIMPERQSSPERSVIATTAA